MPLTHHLAPDAAADTADADDATVTVIVTTLDYKGCDSVLWL